MSEDERERGGALAARPSRARRPDARGHPRPLAPSRPSLRVVPATARPRRASPPRRRARARRAQLVQHDEGLGRGAQDERRREEPRARDRVQQGRPRGRARRLAGTRRAVRAVHQRHHPRDLGEGELRGGGALRQGAPRPPPAPPFGAARRARRASSASGADRRAASRPPALAATHTHRARARARASRQVAERVIDLRGAEVLVDSGPGSNVRVQPVVGGSRKGLSHAAQRAGAFLFRATRATRAPAEGRGRRGTRWAGARGARARARRGARARAHVRRVPLCSASSAQASKTTRSIEAAAVDSTRARAGRTRVETGVG